ncbi:TetR/AcrR family transcriptional regulator [Bacillus timonensis]|nr:TetR/AcrR family transcriptional regulator [Bacillus timonensis]
MNEKRKMILEKAMKLYAIKGYHNTSMQEIANECGVAKGSLYNHFQSKEDLLLSIYKYFYETFSAKMESLTDDGVNSPKSLFAKQIAIQMDEFVKYRDFFQMNMREQTIQNNPQIKSFMLSMRAQALKWYQSRLIDIYGEEAAPYALDCASILNGMMKEYIFFQIIDQKSFDVEKLSIYITHIIDDIMRGLHARKEYFLTSDLLGSDSVLDVQKDEETVETLFLQLKERVKENTDALSSVEALEKEIFSDCPREVVIKALVMMLKSFGMSGIMSNIEKLEKLLEA